MAKKKEIIVNPKSTPADVPTGDVVVLYGHTAIAALSEAGSIACLTADTICEANIGIEYAPPTPATVTIPIYYKTGATLTLITDTALLPGTRQGFTIDEGLSNFNDIDWTETGWTDDSGSNYTPDNGFNTTFARGMLALNYYQPKELPEGKTKYVITLQQ